MLNMVHMEIQKKVISTVMLREETNNNNSYRRTPKIPMILLCSCKPGRVDRAEARTYRTPQNTDL